MIPTVEVFEPAEGDTLERQLDFATRLLADVFTRILPLQVAQRRTLPPFDAPEPLGRLEALDQLAGVVELHLGDMEYLSILARRARLIAKTGEVYSHQTDESKEELASLGGELVSLDEIGAAYQRMWGRRVEQQQEVADALSS